MSLLDNLLRRKPPRDEEDPARRAGDFLDEIARLPADDPRAAVKQINRRIAAVGNALMAEGPLKARFADLSLKVMAAELRRRGERRPILGYRNLPACATVSAEAAADLAGLVQAVNGSGAELTYLAFPTFYGPEGCTPHYALLEIEARLEFAADRRVLAVFLDEVNFIARSDFLREILSGLPATLKPADLTEAFFAAAEKSPGVIFDDGFISAHGYALNRLWRKAG